jgi:hypothetical protein
MLLSTVRSGEKRETATKHGVVFQFENKAFTSMENNVLLS